MRLPSITVSAAVTTGSGIYAFNLFVISAWTCGIVLPIATVSPASGNENLPSGRTITVLVRSGSFHTATLQLIAGVQCVVGELLGEGRFSESGCDQQYGKRAAPTHFEARCGHLTLLFFPANVCHAEEAQIITCSNPTGSAMQTPFLESFAIVSRRKPGR